MCPFAESPFGDNMNAELGFSAALMFVDPLLGVRAGARAGVLLIDDTVRVTVSAVRGVGAGDDAVKGIGNLSRASEFGIMSYWEMRVAKAGTGLQAHHLIESRFKDVMKVKTGDMLSIAVTPAEHQRFTNEWRRQVRYGTDYEAKGMRERVEKAARYVYRDYPDILTALGL
jgi:hypothetical protein